MLFTNFHICTISTYHIPRSEIFKEHQKAPFHWTAKPRMLPAPELVSLCSMGPAVSPGTHLEPGNVFMDFFPFQNKL